ncbi:hypothetical protein [Brunnivagina elsteri]|uniref:hypothetical protein n=1 Tax=Brunnivagina elsteri TaxID=1247191 RepID=UPI0013043670|nr:hypothetical protein [Calothrix elsteri]
MVTNGSDRYRSEQQEYRNEMQPCKVVMQGGRKFSARTDRSSLSPKRRGYANAIASQDCADANIYLTTVPVLYPRILEHYHLFLCLTLSTAASAFTKPRPKKYSCADKGFALAKIPKGREIRASPAVPKPTSFCNRD